MAHCWVVLCIAKVLKKNFDLQPNRNYERKMLRPR